MKSLGTQPIQTERLMLRRIRLSDAQNMFNNWASDLVATKYLTWDPHKDVSETKKIIAMWLDEYKYMHTFRWAIALRDSDEIIGMIDAVKIDLDDEVVTIGYVLSRKYWSQGIMSEALRTICDYLFLIIGVKTIVSHHKIENPASGKVMQNAGMCLDKNPDLKYCILYEHGVETHKDTHVYYRKDNPAPETHKFEP